MAIPVLGGDPDRLHGVPAGAEGIEHDLETIKSTIDDFVSKYNEVMTYINSQFSYDEDAEEVGGVLFARAIVHSLNMR